jgi:hypothetical protein
LKSKLKKSRSENASSKKKSTELTNKYSKLKLRSATSRMARLTEVAAVADMQVEARDLAGKGKAGTAEEGDSLPCPSLEDDLKT